MSGKDSLISFFIDEMNENLEDVSSYLLKLESSFNVDLINKIFRIAHTMKGSAAMMGFSSFSHLSHRFEDILGEIRSGSRDLNSELVDNFFELLDIFKAILYALGEGVAEEEIEEFKQGEELLKRMEMMEVEAEDISQVTPFQEESEKEEKIVETPNISPANSSKDFSALLSKAPTLKKVALSLEKDIKDIYPIFRKEILVHLQSLNEILNKDDFSAMNPEERESFFSRIIKKFKILSEIAEIYGFSFLGDFFLNIANYISSPLENEVQFLNLLKNVFSYLKEKLEGKEELLSEEAQNYQIELSTFLLEIFPNEYKEILKKSLLEEEKNRNSFSKKLLLSSFLDDLEGGFSPQELSEIENESGYLQQKTENKIKPTIKEKVEISCPKEKIKVEKKEKEIVAEETLFEEKNELISKLRSLPQKEGEKLDPAFVSIFIEEGRENIVYLKNNLDVLLDFKESVDKLEQLIRSAHTIKGSAAMVGLKRISALGKALEFLFKDVLNKQVSLNVSQRDFLKFVLQILEDILQEVEEKQCEITQIDPILEAFNSFWSFNPEKFDFSVLLSQENISEKASQKEKIETKVTPEVKESLVKSEKKISVETRQSTKDVSQNIFSEKKGEEKKSSFFQPKQSKVDSPKSDRRSGKDRRRGIDRRSGFDRRLERRRSRDEGAKTVRVGIEKLDSLINLTGELVINKIRLDQKLEHFSTIFSELTMKSKLLNKLERDMEDLDELIETASPEKKMDLEEFNQFDEIKVSFSTLTSGIESLIEKFTQLHEELTVTADRVGKITVDLQENIMKIRMFPIERVFSRFPRVVRDLARETGKEIELIISGEHTELDKTVIEKIGDPLMHLIRNAIDHGIELPDDRVLLGKNRKGTIKLNAYHRGNHIVIEIEDDGRGIDTEKIKEIALKKGIVTERDLKQMSPREIMNLIFVPGFSTKQQVSDISGRGVGMDVVRNNIMALKGTIDIFSEVGKGTRIVIRLPLTLAIIQALIVSWGEEDYVIPINSVMETTIVYKKDLKELGNKRLFFNRGEYLPLLSLGHIIQSPYQLENQDKSIVVVVTTGEKVFGIEVDKLKGKHEIVVKNLGFYLKGVKNISSATILGDGRVLLILDIAQISRFFNERKEIKTVSSMATLEKDKAGIGNKKYKILVVDDSPTVRSIEKNLLENAGYEVICAENGLQAYEILKLDQIDMVISDVEMPKMNGFELTEKIRGIEQFKNLPIIIITTKVSDEHKKIGLDLGANLYLGKPFEQDNLLKAVAKLLEEDER